MAVYTSSALTLRRKLIVEELRSAGAVSPESAKALSDTCLQNPDLFSEYTEKLADMGVIRSAGDGKYYYPEEDPE